jgi:hypothetical protein
VELAFRSGQVEQVVDVVRRRVADAGIEEEPPVPVEEQMADSGEPPQSVAPATTPIERRAGWVDRRQQREDR